MEEINISYRQLFGGFCSASIPECYKDTSTHVEVPDNQEVFSDVTFDSTLIIELLERESIEDAKCISFLFNDLAEFNEAEDYSRILKEKKLDTEEVPNFTECPAYYLLGEQGIVPNKRPNEPREDVKIFIGVIRLESRQTDLMISINLPFKPNTVSQEQFALRFEKIEEWFKTVLKTFKIEDYSLFETDGA
eukprot:CAMPEP_0115045924 /NCGR_PEP_ID=MMETSP0216-20121206/48460_1 /TAXON_ID=223996 /ORGANISM="Protocruzia adherens, Strain Boccale" /LENGTH=190 /DNA_ID=CAMNT_0002428941 /DNA_START=42 /DNA_END=614 /DNA_ORIENTATION=+